MILSRELPHSLSQLADGLSVVFDRLLQNLVFLHEILRGDLIFPSVFYHHVKLLFAHPGFSLVSVEEILLRLLPLGEVVFTLLDGVCKRTLESSSQFLT